MKKCIAALLAVLLVGLCFAACTSQNPESSTPVESEEASSEAQDSSVSVTPVTVRIAGLTGPTSMGLVKMMEDDATGESENDYEFTLAGSADEITPKLIQGELDMAAIPSNLASVLYNNTEGKIQVLAVNTLGVIYIVEKGETVSALSDLKGKTIYATGKGSTPEYALRYILTQNGIDPDKDVTIEWKSEPAEIVSLFETAESGIAMMPQPYVTVAQSKIEGLRVAVDLNQEWEKLDNGSRLLTGVMVVRKEFAEAHPDVIKAFLKEYEASIEYTNQDVENAAQLIEKYNIFKAAVAKKAIPYCNITFLSGTDMKTAMQGYLQVLFDQNPASVGGKLPDDAFYYEK